MPVSDAVYAALGEVEAHERVEVGDLDPASIRGIEAPSLVHVLAELIENALRYSPLDAAVEVGGSLTPAGYTILVRDHGGGMIDHDIVRANQRLAGEDSPGVVPTRYLGHFVAGHLARRMGVVVRLRTTPEGGITACIEVPLALLGGEQTATALIPEPPLMPAPGAAGRAGGLALFPVGPSMYTLVAARRPRGDDAFVGVPAPRRVSV
jgi:K+-sensing histidine kinase KdpD